MNSLLKVAQFGRYGFKLFSEQFSLIFSGINGLLALKDIVNHKGWKLTANEHFDPVSDFSTLDVSPQLEAIRKTRTRIVVLNTIYSRDTDASVTNGNAEGMGLDCDRWIYKYGKSRSA